MRCEKLYLKDYFPILGENNANPMLDIYLPYNMTEMNRQDQKRPCILICPGGAYAMCSQRESEPIALNFLTEGFNAFVLTYSVAPHRFPTQIREVAATMELIYKNAEEWNCDTEKIAIIGFSAGGHLASHYSTMFDCKEVREMFPESKPVNASILSYPVITADPIYAHKGSFENLLGHHPDDEEINYFSTDRNVSERHPQHFYGTPRQMEQYLLQTLCSIRRRLQVTKFRLRCIYILLVITVFQPVINSPVTM